eukprot:3327758-Rhodomonas_salina.1
MAGAVGALQHQSRGRCSGNGLAVRRVRMVVEAVAFRQGAGVTVGCYPVSSLRQRPGVLGPVFVCLKTSTAC